MQEVENIARVAIETTKVLKQEVLQEVPEKQKRRKVQNSQNNIKKENFQEKKSSWLIPDHGIR